MDQTPHISTSQDSPLLPPPPPTPESKDDLHQQQNQAKSITTATSVDTNCMRDIYLWKRKNLSLTILLVATSIWILLEIYKSTFITMVSWIGMFFFTSMFFWGNMHRLLKKEAAPNMSGLEMSEHSVRKIANSIRQSIETLGKWMFSVGAEGEWFEFAGVVGPLYLISLVAKYLDFLTFLYIGVVAGLSLSMIYVRYENRIKH